MFDPVQSVTGRLLPFVQARQQFTDPQEAWDAFLDYLSARKGVDISGPTRMRDLAVASRFVNSEEFEHEHDPSDPDVEWFQRFERRVDVLAALDQFLRYRGLSGQELGPAS